MNKSISAIAIKLFGVYIGFSFITLLPSLFMLFSINTGMKDQQWSSILIIIAYLLIYLIVAFAFIFKTQFIIRLFKFPDESKDDFYKDLKPSQLSIGLILIGIYFLIYSLPYLILYIISFTKFNTGSITWAQCGAKVITSILSTLLILKSKAIEAYLLKKMNRNPNEIAPLDDSPNGETADANLP